MSKLDATSLARQVMNEAMAVSRLIADLVSGDVQVHKASGWGHVCAWLCSTVIVMQRVLDMYDSMEAEFAKRLLLLSHAVANTRFAFEEFGTVAPAQRVVQRNNHCVAVEQGMGWVVHRGSPPPHHVPLHHHVCPHASPVNRLTQSMGVDWRPYRRDVKAIVFNPEHPLKNAEMQLLWRTFFGKRLVVTRRELFAAIQNDLRDRGVAMYSPKELKFVGQLMDTATEEVLSAQELQTFFNIWGATLPDAGASSLVDVVAAARRNVFYLLPDGQRQEWFVAPWMQPFFNNSDMYWTLKGDVCQLVGSACACSHPSSALRR